MCLIGLVLWAWQQWPQPELKLVFCSVGQGDATLMIYKDRQILVDGGPNNRVLDCLGQYLPFWDREIELVIASHAEADHITGLIEVARRYRIGLFLLEDAANDTAEYRALSEVIKQQGIPIKAMVRGDAVKLGPISLTWLNPETNVKVLGAKTSLNRFSQVIKGSFGEFDWLMTGDIDANIERNLIAGGVVSEVELLKVAHHGSKYSSSQEFLTAVSPELAVIEVGKNNFGHPTAETLGRLSQAGAQIERTDEDGDVVIISDGVNWRVE